MHIIAIGWIYVVLMMAIAESSVVAAIMTFLMYGVLPVAIILYKCGNTRRRRRRLLLNASAAASAADAELATAPAEPLVPGA
jgi:hypothetical protein